MNVVMHSALLIIRTAVCPITLTLRLSWCAVRSSSAPVSLSALLLPSLRIQRSVG